MHRSVAISHLPFTNPAFTFIMSKSNRLQIYLEVFVAATSNLVVYLRTMS